MGMAGHVEARREASPEAARGGQTPPGRLRALEMGRRTFDHAFYLERAERECFFEEI